MFKIYTAHPISGLSGKEVFDYYDDISNKLKDTFIVLCPMTGKDYLRTEDNFKAHGYNMPLATDHAIFGRDSWMVSQSDFVLCDFTGAKTVSIGCCMELAIARTLGKQVVVVMEPDNIHHHAFIHEASTIIFEDIDSAITYLNLFGRK